MKKLILENNIPIVLKENKNTPRIAITFYLKINKPEQTPGEYSLLNRLLMQGTKTRTSEQIAVELDENAIECGCEMKHDFIRFKLLCLNEDIEKSLELLSDMIENSTMTEIEKEKIKLKGEIEADLDSPKAKTLDAFYKTLYEGHTYGHTYTLILENIDSINKENIEKIYKDILENSPKVISVAGEFEESRILELFNKYFAGIKNGNIQESTIPIPVLKESKVVKLKKEDASQAQIIQGWLLPTIYSKDYAAVMLLNTILGASGLSSRLFVELRDKKGLAYVVRSSYEIFNNVANFSVYIATEPKNIKTSLEGFKIELDKIKNTLIGEEELENAKNNLIGKREFFTETNLQQSSLIAFYEDKNLGCDFEEKLVQMVKNVTAQDIMDVANNYIKEPNVLTILAPEEYLQFTG